MRESVAMTRLTDNIQRIMKEQSLSVQELADRCDMARSAVSRIIHGHHSPTVDTVERIAQALQVPIECIFADNKKLLSAAC